MTKFMELIRQVIDTGINFLNFLWQTLQSLFILIKNMPTYMATLRSLITYLPAIYQGIIAATIGLSVLFMITNRGK